MARGSTNNANNLIIMMAVSSSKFYLFQTLTEGMRPHNPAYSRIIPRNLLFGIFFKQRPRKALRSVDIWFREHFASFFGSFSAFFWRTSLVFPQLQRRLTVKSLKRCISGVQNPEESKSLRLQHVCSAPSTNSKTIFYVCPTPVPLLCTVPTV